MPLSDALTEPPKALRCIWSDLLTSMRDDDRTVATVMMEGGEYDGTLYEQEPIKRLSRVLRAEGYRIGAEQLYLHRNRECSCPS